MPFQPLYGTPEWSSRAVYDAYVGWFSGNVEELFPLAPDERSRKMIEYMGEDAVSRRPMRGWMCNQKRRNAK